MKVAIVLLSTVALAAPAALAQSSTSTKTPGVADDGAVIQVRGGRGHGWHGNRGHHYGWYLGRGNWKHRH
ncbi:hypothetical protein [Bradyrhizobium genosp. A]|uniref:hypothetical protein n=1 Tax=Bradyrhizobium genosp. A TaxID=83626 RepID=UPI003CF4C3F4